MARKLVPASVIDAIEAEYIAGATSYELGEKYGFDHSAICRWMMKRGHFRGKGGARDTARKRLDGKLVFEKYLKENYGCRFTVVQYINKKTPFILRCNICGTEFKHSGWTQTSNFTCPFCYEQVIARKKEKQTQQRLAKEQLRKKEYAKEKICQSCGGVFHSELSTQKYCSNRCKTSIKIQKKLARDRKKTELKQAAELQKEKICADCGGIFHSVYESKKYCDKCAARHRHCDHKERAERYGVEYDPQVTLEKLIERDNNVCQICGEICDKTDRRYGSHGPLYPSIDHITAMANGGGHVWGNVQLAHVICNSIKRDLQDDELAEEVISRAKEQAIAYKCAGVGRSGARSA